MIGSKTKRAKFESWAVGGTGALMCPMAAAHKGDRRPEVIAAFVVAEVLRALTKAHSKELADE
jgi:xanthine dehydrogenase accessory factor